MTDDENMTQDESWGDEGSIDKPNEASPPSPKKSKYLSALLAAKQKGKDQQNEDMSSIEMELDRYISAPSAQSVEDDPFEFWLQNMTVFPNLSVLTFSMCQHLQLQLSKFFQLEVKQQLGSETTFVTITWNEKCLWEWMICIYHDNLQFNLSV